MRSPSAARRWLPQAVFSVFVVVLCVRLLDLLAVRFDDTLNRTTVVTTFGATLTGSQFLDTLVLAGSGAAYAALLAYHLNEGRLKELLNWDSVLALTAAGSALGLAAMAAWLLYPVFPLPVYQGAYWTAAALVDQSFQVLGLLSPLLLIMIIFPWVVRVGVGSGFTLAGKSEQQVQPEHPVPRRWDWPNVSIIAGAAALVVLGAAYPYLGGVNPGHVNVSVDTDRYLAWIAPALSAGGLSAWVHAIFTPSGSFPGAYSGDLPLFLAFLQGVAVFAGGVQAALYLMPLVLGAMLALSSFWVMQAWRGDLRISALSALFSVYSYQVLAGIYSGFFANWFAIVLLNVMLGVLIVDWRAPSRPLLPALALLSAGIFLAHPYTWLVTAAVLVGVIVWEASTGMRTGRLTLDRRVGGSLAALSAGAVTALVQAVAFSFNALSWGSSQVASSAFGLAAFFSRSLNLAVSLNVLYAGLLNNPVLLLLVVFWVALPKSKEFGNRFLVAWLALSAIPVLFASTTIQSRTLYDLPLQFPAAMGLVSLSERLESRRKWLGVGLAALLLIIETDFFLRSLANLVPRP
jgi:hypothetical protein